MREKIKLVSSAGTGHFYTTKKNKRNTPEKNRDQKVRSGCPQARCVQGSQDQVIPDPASKKARPMRRAFFLTKKKGKK